MIKLFDSHCHPQFPQYDADRDEVIKRTLAAGCGMICVGTDLEDSRKAIELAEKHDLIWATVGSHPNEKATGDWRLATSILKYEELAKHPKVVAIGETGSDYYRTPEKDKQEKQKEVFRQFLELSNKLGKPIVIHCRDPLRRSESEASAYDGMFDILKNNPVAGIIHSFTGNFELAQKFLDLGLFLGLNGIITFTNEYDDMIAKIPLGKILIETDAPYLAPVPHRGKRNEPLWVEFVARRIAEIKKVSFEEVAEKTTENAKKLFKLK